MSVYRNVEEIIRELKQSTKYIKDYHKFDGITIECTATSMKDRDKAIKEIKAVCKDLKLFPVSVEKKSTSDVLFAVQFPELEPEYNDEELKYMYEANFKFLFDNLKSFDKSRFTRTILIENMNSLVKNAIRTYCKSNINKYKDNEDNYFNDVEYRAKLNGWYLAYLERYLMGE